MPRLNVSLVCLLTLSLAGSALAQTAVDPNADSGVVSMQDYSGGATLRGTYFDIRHMSGQGVGYESGYTQIGGFTPFWLSEDMFIASNSRLLVTDTNRVGANTGLVGRKYVSEWDRIFGVYGYYDNDETQYGNRYTQIAFGMETLGQSWDFRANGYATLGTTDRLLGPICVAGDPYYVGNQIAFLGTQRREESMNGADFEFGVPVTPSTPWLRAYAGMYGYQSSDEDPVGVRGRIEAWVSDDLSLSVNVTEDRQFGTNVNAVVDFRFSGFKPTRYFPKWTTEERMLNPVQRNWRVTTGTYIDFVNVAAINPADGDAYFIAHVNNTAAPGGDGSFERPFNTLPAAVPGADIILVARGTSTEGAPYVGSITLEDDQRLLGEGRLHTAQLFASYGRCTVEGVFALPGTANTGNFPFVSSAGNIVTLANNNEVSAFNFINAGGDAITNTAAGSNGFLLQNLEITGNTGRGINLTNATGLGIIRNVNLASGSTNHPNPGGLGNNIGGGIFVDTGAAGLTLAMTSVAMNSDPPGTSAFGVSLLADDGDLLTVFDTVQANGNVTGIRLEETGRTLNATLNNVSASGNTGVGVQAVGTGGTLLLTSPSLTANNNGLDNLQITTTAGTVFGGNFTDSFFNGSTGGSGIVLNMTGGTGLLNLTNVQANGNGVDGLALIGAAGATLNVNVVDSFMTDNLRDGHHIDGATVSTIRLFVDPTDIRRNGRDALFFNLTGDSVFEATYLNDLMDNSGRSAVHGQMDFSTARLVFNNTTGTTSGEHGLFLNAVNNSLASIQVTDGSFANSSQSLVNGFDGVHIQSNASIVNLGLTNTPANNILPNSTQRIGLAFNAVNFSNFTANVTGGDLTNNLTNAVRANVTSGSTAVLNLTDTPSSNSGADGFFANVDSATFVANVTNSDFNNSGFITQGNGLELRVSNTGFFTGNFSNSSFNSNGFDGMHAIVSGAGSVASINLSNGSLVTNNGQDGLGFVVNDGRLNVTAVDSSFSNNGVTGVNGNGIVGLVNNTGSVLLDLTNTPVTGNLDNGIFVTATGGSDVRVELDNSPVDGNGLTTNGDGVRLDLSGSPDSLLLVSNGTTINDNGGDGVEINATNGTVFTAVFNGTPITNNGQSAGAGNGVIANVNASNVTLSFDTVTIGNIAPNVTEQIGFQFNVQNAGVLTAGFVDSDLSNNSASAVEGTVDGAGSVATVTLDNTLADNSGLFGAVLNVTGGGLLNFNALNGSSISNSSGAGVLATVDGAGSVANFEFNQVAINTNGQILGGEGFDGAALNGGTLNVCLDTTTVSGNANQGLDITVDGVGSLARFGVENSTIGADALGLLLGNGSEGMLASVTNSGTLLYRSTGSTYLSNGASLGGQAGVSVTAVGDGGADTATALLLFSGDTVDGNQGDGFFFDAQNGATLTAEINNTDSTNNGVSGAGFGINFNASGATTKAALLMGGGNDLSGNASGPLNVNVVTPIDQIVLSLNGSFDNSTGDGVNVTIDGANTAIVAIQGPGTINNSADNGIFVRLANVNNGSLLIGGINSISDSGQDGIHVEFDTVNQAAIEINGIGAINNSGDDGVDVSVINSNLVNGFNVPGATIPRLTLVDSDLLNDCLPIRVDTPIDTSGLVPTTAFTINSVFVDNSANRGINVFMQNSTAEDDGIAITNNASNNSQNGDGILLELDTVTAPGGTPLTGVLISGNSADTNSGNGINFDFLNTPIDRLQITNNRGGVSVNTGLTFLIDGNTFPIGFGTGNFSIANASDPGIQITDFTFDTSTSVSGALYNTVSGANFPFTPFGGTDVTTGLQTVLGTPVPPYPDPLVPDFSQLLTFTFNGFDPGETFAWDIDADLTAGGDESVFGNDLIGSTINVNFTGGLTLGGTLVAVGGDPDASTFVATTGNIGGTGIANNGLDGIRFNLNNSSLTNLVMDNNQIESNGTTGVGHGVNFESVVNSDITGTRIWNNEITGNQGDGVRIVNPDTIATDLVLSFSNNTIDTNTGSGVNLSVVANAQNLRVSMDTNSISGNTGGPGVNVTLADNRNYTGGFNANTISNNGAEGVDFNLGVNSVVTSDFTGNTINGNGSHGINVPLQTGGRFVSANFYNNTIGTEAARNGGMGLRVIAPDQASFAINLGDSAQGANNITGNTDAGVGIDMTGASNGSLTVVNSTLSNTVNGGDINFNGEGLSIRMNNTASLPNLTIGDAAVANTTFEDNASHGIAIVIDASSQLVNPLVQNTVSQNNTGDGLNVVREAFGVIDNFVITDSTFENNADGIDIIARFSPQVDEYTLTNNQVINNNGRGLSFVAQADSQIDTILTDNTFTGNGNDGVFIGTVGVAGDAANVTSNLGAWTGNTFSNNGLTTGAAGAGLQISGVHTLNIGTLAAGNLFQDNQGDGIEVNAPGVLNIINATITGNNLEGSGDGLAGIDINSGGGNIITVSNSTISNNLGDGVEIDNTGPFTFITLTDNLIQFNERDGIEFMDQGSATLNISATAPGLNLITDNTFRGVDIVVAGGATSSVTIDNTNIERNDQEGVNTILSADAAQTTAAFRDNLSGAALSQNGGIGNTPFLSLDLTNNLISNNGQVAGNIGGSGIVMRVGTTRGGDGFATAGGAGTGFASAANGGIIANVTGNALTGNFGADVLFESFRSTANPATTGGAWTDQNENPRNPANDVFTPTGYQSDPIARLDLVFNNNSGDEIDATRQGAFYNNDEPVFKSRTQAQDNGTDGGPDDNGPFGSGTRQRNAQRLAARDVNIGGTQLPPLLTIGASDAFLFPGMGQSTFRVDTTGGGNVFGTITSGFLTDNNPYTDFLDANGVPLGAPAGGPLGIDLMPWGWTSLP